MQCCQLFILFALQSIKCQQDFKYSKVDDTERNKPDDNNNDDCASLVRAVLCLTHYECTDFTSADLGLYKCCLRFVEPVPYFKGIWFGGFLDN